MAHARRTLAALVPVYPTRRVPLSAGRDSRAVLACVRPFAEAGGRVELFTTARDDAEGRVDLDVARRLAAITGLPHDAPGPKGRAAGGGGGPDPAAPLRAFVRMGEARAGRLLGSAAGAGREGKAGQLSLPGMAGETARAFYWGDAPPRASTARDLVRRLQVPEVPQVLDAARAWLDGLPAAASDPRDVLDLAYVEQRLGGWDAPSKYLFQGRDRANVSLMGTTCAIETMLRLAPRERARGSLQRAIVAHGWPELLTLPFNLPVGWRRPLASLRRQAPRMARRALGRLIGR